MFLKERVFLRQHLCSFSPVTKLLRPVIPVDFTRSFRRGRATKSMTELKSEKAQLRAYGDCVVRWSGDGVGDNSVARH